MKHHRTTPLFSKLFPIVATLLIVAACSVQNLPGLGDLRSTPSEKAATVILLHALRGHNAEMVERLVAGFNESQEGLTVQAVSVGSYAETIDQALHVSAFTDPPALIHVSDLGVQTMVDSGLTAPVHSLNQGEVDWADMVTPIRNYYSVNDELVCMPLNASTAVLYFNRNALTRAGLDPETPPTTWDELAAQSQTVMDEGVADGGFSMSWPAWVLEESYALHNQPFTNNSNGRMALATEVNLSNKFGINLGPDLLRTWQRMARDGVLVYGGRTYKATDPFLRGKFPFLIESTASLPTLVEEAIFEVGVAPLPRVVGYGGQGNTPVTGGCIWVMASASAEEQAVAWAFLQYLFAPEQQAAWHKATGYLPINLDAIDALKDEGWFDEHPRYGVGLSEMLGGNKTPASTGALMGEYQQVRDLTGDAIEEILFREVNPPQVLDEASHEIRVVLAKYAGIEEEADDLSAVVAALTEPTAAPTAESVSVDEVAAGEEETDAVPALRLWYHGASNEVERELLLTIVTDFNASQEGIVVEMQDFPEESYNQSVILAAEEGRLPDIIDVDAPVMPNWAWSGYLAPLNLSEGTLDEFLPGAVGEWDGQLYSVGLWDAAKAIFARRSVLEANDIRIPTLEDPWTFEEFDAALETLHATGDFEYAFDPGMAQTGEWYPYAFSPFLQSFGGDIIDRRSYSTAEGALNGEAALAFARWWQSLFERGLAPDATQSSEDRDAGFIDGRYALQWNGNWAALPALEAFGDDLLFLPSPDFGNGPTIGAGSWQFGVAATSEMQDQANAFIEFALQDEYLAAFSDGIGLIPATAGAAALSASYAEGGPLEAFFELSNRQALIRPPTPAYLNAARIFEEAIAEISAGAEITATLNAAVRKIDADIAANDGYAMGD